MVYSYTHGRCKTEQDAVLALDDFLVNTIGWTRVDTVSDTTTNRDYVWKSTGDSDWVSSGGDPIYIRVRGELDKWVVYGYRTYTDSVTYTFELYDATGSNVDLSASWLRYWFYGDKNFVCCIFYDESNDYPISCYLGLINPYYDITNDDYPLLIKGQSSYTYGWVGTEECYMYDCVSSGVSPHDTTNWWTILQYDRGVRDGGYVVMLPSVLVNRTTGELEVRGEPHGVYQINGNRISNFDSVATASGVYLAFRFNKTSSTSTAFGPVSESPDTFDMWGPGDVWVDGVKQ